MNLADAITVVVLTSPVSSHPETFILDHCLNSVRYHLPECPILLLADGVREEDEERRADYHKYLEIVARRRSVRLKVSPAHIHQVGLMRRYFDQIETPLLLFMEHDTALLPRPIPWKGIVETLLDDDIMYIRFNQYSAIPQEHRYLMLEEICSYGVPLTKTVQFHARPNVARKEFYALLLSWFSTNANCFIEDHAYPICERAAWDLARMTIFTPPGNQKRSYHLDARQSGPKFEDKQVF